MEKIIREYATIYIDRNNEFVDFFEKEKRNEELEDSEIKSIIVEFVEELLLNEYYNTPNCDSILCNFYILIAKNDTMNKTIIDILQNDGMYARKFVMCKEDINDFVNDVFPEYTKTESTFTLLTGKHKYEAIEKSQNEEYDNSNIVESYNYIYNEMDTLSNLDELRSEFIKGCGDVVYYTHLETEISFVKKKFDFLQEKFIVK